MGKVGEIKNVSIELLKEYENNAKVHSREQVGMIADSIKEFGFISPLLIDNDYNIIAGHGRVEASRLLGIKEVPCVFIEGLNEAQRRAYILADNKLTELGGWDVEKVTNELKEIEEFNFDFESFDVKSLWKDIDLDDKEGEIDYVEPKEHGYSIAYELVFNSEDEQENWYDFLMALKRRYPDYDTISERVLLVANLWMDSNGR